MRRISRRRFLQASGTATALSLLGINAGQADNGNDSEPVTRNSANTNPEQGLVGTWTASPVKSAEKCFDDQTLRMIARTSVGGDGVRVRLANTFGSEPVTFDHITIGIRKKGATLVAGSNREVTFGGEPSVTIPPGAKVYSDTLALKTEPEQDLAVSIYAPKPTGPATKHTFGLTTNYVSSGDHTSDLQGNAFEIETTSYFFLEAIDVVSPDTEGAIVTLGDSITDGYGSTVDENKTYPDILAKRLNDTSSVQKSVLNAGIGGNEILGNDSTGGESALARLNRDVLAQTGITDVILLEGINDIGHATEEPETTITAEEVIFGMKQIITRVRTKEIRIFGSTLTPYKGYTSSYRYTEEGEKKRQKVNEWIRTSDAFDGVIDFDKAVRDPENPKRLRPEYTCDKLHPNDVGYQAMAETIDLDKLAAQTEKRGK